MELTSVAPPELRSIADLPGPKGRPLMGNVRDINRRPLHQALEDWSRQFGAMYRFRVMRKTILATSDRDLIASLLRDRPDAVRRSSRTADMLNEVGTRGLFTAEGEDWRRQRKLVMRALTPEVIHNFFPTLTALTERLHQRWEAAIAAGKPVDVLRDLKAYTLDVTIGLAMGQDINTLELEEHPLQRDIEFLFHMVAKRLTSPFAYWRVSMLKRADDHEAIAAAARIQTAIFGFIAEVRKRIELNPALRQKPSNMLEALIVARDEPDSGLTDEAVVGNAITMVFAGEDTTSNTTAWLIDFLSTHPQAAQRMAAETGQVLGAKAVLDDYHLLDRLKYIDAATREAMRLKPVAPVMAAQPTEDMVVGDLWVPAGTVIFLLLRQSSERDCELAQPESFQPERWLEGANGSGDDPARKLFPFGGGPRFCPGRYLAMAEIKMAMSMLVKNFAIERVPGAAPVEERFTFTMTPSSLPVRLIKKT
ncbi:cytochrome P450 [Duganella sp. BJB488]|uniref:cytochrome P450 n=1 Tax=unclassified Duganella TaxID=2636909 RepID=UPI000E35167D|nr:MULTISPECIES: cytochrome P450 [unclassified Duganella]RFP20275.1 cytochrome P450 [Duganella sp. BJB489]RFP21279.1 cytochrome P450 [Duganella sp. BJB488]RFP33421.1 cytochrome P450 [Duganella sp. BJB480]